MAEKRDQVVVVGAGVAGLACAVDLARSGLDVTVVERAARSGGKMREVTVGPRPQDAGPTVFTMRWVFEGLFDEAGASLETAIELKPLDVLARHAWRDGGRLDLFANIERSADAIGAFAGAAEARGYLRFCAEGEAIFRTLKSSFLTSEQTGPLGLAARIGLHRAGELTRIRPFETLWTALGDHFRDPRLRQLFGRYATYCGSSPFAAPATLMLIAHVEQAGVWAVEGGMQRLADAMEALARSLGVTFRFGTEAEEISTSGGRVSGVRLRCGERLRADQVVAGADNAALSTLARGAPSTAARDRRSLSAVTWSVLARTSGFPLSRHNVFFSDDYPAEFRQLMEDRRLPTSPTVYVCAQDRADDGGAPKAERLLILVNAPADGDHAADDEEALQTCQAEVFQRLRDAGLEVSLGDALMTRTTPADFNRLFPATGGALYGAATHGWNAAFRRPGARTRIPGLYLAGGGAHPGAGVPMAALSGRIAARRLISDRASTRRFHRVAMSGGTSTP